MIRLWSWLDHLLERRRRFEEAPKTEANFGGFQKVAEVHWDNATDNDRRLKSHKLATSRLYPAVSSGIKRLLVELANVQESDHRISMIGSSRSKFPEASEVNGRSQRSQRISLRETDSKCNPRKSSPALRLQANRSKKREASFWSKNFTPLEGREKILVNCNLITVHKLCDLTIGL